EREVEGVARQRDPRDLRTAIQGPYRHGLAWDRRQDTLVPWVEGKRAGANVMQQQHTPAVRHIPDFEFRQPAARIRTPADREKTTGGIPFGAERAALCARGQGGEQVLSRGGADFDRASSASQGHPIEGRIQLQGGDVWAGGQLAFKTQVRQRECGEGLSAQLWSIGDGRGLAHGFEGVASPKSVMCGTSSWS